MALLRFISLYGIAIIILVVIANFAPFLGDAVILYCHSCISLSDCLSDIPLYPKKQWQEKVKL